MFVRSAMMMCMLVGTTLASASVVYTGVSLSARLLGRWRVVQVFGNNLQATPPLTIELDKAGRLIGRSECGTFKGRWSTGRNEVRFQGLVPSNCTCGSMRKVEQQVIDAMVVARETRVEKGQVVLMHEGRPVALLVPQRT